MRAACCNCLQDDAFYCNLDIDAIVANYYQVSNVQAGPSVKSILIRRMDGSLYLLDA